MVLVVVCGTRHHLMSCGFLVGDMSGFPRKAGKWVGVVVVMPAGGDPWDGNIVPLYLGATEYPMLLL